MAQRESRAWRVTGRVQGVGFRYFVVQRARDLGLVGWTCNREDGTVEVQASGAAAALDLLEAALRQGPAHAKVFTVTSVHPSEALEGKGGFTIEYDLA